MKTASNRLSGSVDGFSAAMRTNLENYRGQVLISLPPLRSAMQETTARLTACKEAGRSADETGRSTGRLHDKSAQRLTADHAVNGIQMQAHARVEMTTHFASHRTPQYQELIASWARQVDARCNLANPENRARRC